jgi:heme O synthase-like polyprenyltransferase
MHYAHWRIYFRTFLQMFVPGIIYIDVNNTIGSLFTKAKQHMDAVLMLRVCVCVCVCVGRVCVCAAGAEEG